jgi:hypothetical protein
LSSSVDNCAPDSVNLLLNMSNNLSDISVRDLKKAIKIKAKLDKLNAQFDEIMGGAGSGMPSPFVKRGMSAAGRKRIALAQKKRWAKVKGKNSGSKGRRKMSAAAKARISASAKRRWKAAKAAGKSRL